MAQEMTEREALREALYDAWWDQDDPAPAWNERMPLNRTWDAMADAILAQWRLVPVDQDYQIAWLTYRNPDGSMRYTTIASGHGDGDWIVDGSVATGYAEVQVVG